VYLRALFTYLLPPPSLAQATTPETDSVGAMPLSYSNLVQYDAWCRRETLYGALKRANYKHETPVLASPTQAETASSGVRPTKIRISAGSSRMESSK
jgi:hypothetical protein